MAIPQPYPQPGPQGPGAPQEQTDLPEVRPARIWYWVGVLLFPLGLLLTAVILLAGDPSSPSAWILLTPAAVVLSTVWIVVVYMLRDRSERRRRSLLPPPPTLVHAAAYPGGPVQPVWFQPRSAPPLEGRNLRPRRLWYGVAVGTAVLSSPVAGVAGIVVADWLGAVLFFLLFIVVPPTLSIVVMVKRTGHRRRITREHLEKEWEQAHRS